MSLTDLSICDGGGGIAHSQSGIVFRCALSREKPPGQKTERRRRRDVCKKSAFRCLSCVNIPSELLPAQYYLHSHSYMHLELSGSESRDDITLMFDRQTCQVEVISSGNGCFVTVGCVQQTLETDVGNTKET